MCNCWPQQGLQPDGAPTIQRVSEAWIPHGSEIHYPLKATYDAKFYTITPPTVSSDVFDVTEQNTAKDGNSDSTDKGQEPNVSVEGGNDRQETSPTDGNKDVEPNLAGESVDDRNARKCRTSNMTLYCIVNATTTFH